MKRLLYLFSLVMFLAQPVTSLAHRDLPTTANTNGDLQSPLFKELATGETKKVNGRFGYLTCFLNFLYSQNLRVQGFTLAPSFVHTNLGEFRKALI